MIGIKLKVHLQVVFTGKTRRLELMVNHSCAAETDSPITLDTMHAFNRKARFVPKNTQYSTLSRSINSSMSAIHDANSSIAYVSFAQFPFEFGNYYYRLPLSASMRQCQQLSAIYLVGCTRACAVHMDRVAGWRGHKSTLFTHFHTFHTPNNFEHNDCAY